MFSSSGGTNAHGPVRLTILVPYAPEFRGFYAIYLVRMDTTTDTQKRRYREHANS
jgi:hypothetical protein